MSKMLPDNPELRAKGVKVMKIGELKKPPEIPTSSPMGVPGTTRGKSKPAGKSSGY